MEILKLMDVLEEIIVKGGHIPFSGRCMVDKAEALELLKEMRSRLPEDMKHAKRILDDRQKILMDAQREANSIIHEAESKVQLLIDDNKITKQATDQAREIIDNSQKKAREMRLGARDYIDGMLSDMEKFYLEKLNEIQNNRKSLK